MSDGTTTPAAATAQVDALIRELEQQMPDLQLRHGNVFALANAWAERYDAIIAVTPRDMQASVEARLSRIGIRWGMMPGARVTTEFRALDHGLLQAERLRMLAESVPSQGTLSLSVAPHDAPTTAALASGELHARSAGVTTTSQQTVLSNAELGCLLECARGAQVVDPAIAQALVAKGMLEDADGRHVLTPAGQHALHVDQPGAVPGIDT